ncbi:hypothetical protein KR026_003212, partial [Drosophila bipectinata]
MKAYDLLLSILLILHPFSKADRGTVSDLSDDTFELLISGGHKPDSNRYSRHVVSIRTLNYVEVQGDNHFCSGTLISSRAVLTAAHCVTDRYKASMNPRGLRVIFGHVDRLAYYTEDHTSRVDQIMVHPKYERYKSHDLAILWLTTRIPSHNHDVVPLLMRKKANLTVGIHCITMGWGQIYQHGPYSDELLYMDVIISNSSRCDENISDFNEEESVCVKPMKEGEYCAGDMGGPLICRGALAGIIGGSLGCAGGKAMKFVSFPKYRKWIVGTVHGMTASKRPLFVYLPAYYWILTN